MEIEERVILENRWILEKGQLFGERTDNQRKDENLEKEWIQEIRWIFGGKTERWSKDGYLENIQIFGEFMNIGVGMDIQSKYGYWRKLKNE